MHEAKMYEENAFVTLTYNDENLPKDGSLNMKHFQDFMKRLRQRLKKPIRYFHCGEYGEKTGRPHYHACLFGVDFPDRKLWRSTGGKKLFTSAKLEDVWSFGYCVIGQVTFDSANYVAGYVTKKLGDKATRVIFNKEENKYYPVKSEYGTMSRNPGLGKSFLDTYKEDIYSRHYIIVNGKKVKPPLYYDRIIKEEEEAKRKSPVRQTPLEILKGGKADNSEYGKYEKSDRRLRVKEKVTTAKHKMNGKDQL